MSELTSKPDLHWGLQLGPLISIDETSLVDKSPSRASPPHDFAELLIRISFLLVCLSSLSFVLF
jgi:hypothetical protein